MCVEIAHFDGLDNAYQQRTCSRKITNVYKQDYFQQRITVVRKRLFSVTNKLVSNKENPLLKHNLKHSKCF